MEPLEVSSRLALITDLAFMQPRLLPDQATVFRILDLFRQQSPHPLSTLPESHDVWPLRSQLYTSLRRFCTHRFRDVLPLDCFWQSICSMDYYLFQVASHLPSVATLEHELVARFGWTYFLDAEVCMEEPDLYKAISHWFGFIWADEERSMFERQALLLPELAFFEDRLTIKDVLDIILAEKYGQGLASENPETWNPQKHLDWLGTSCRLYVRLIDLTLERYPCTEWDLLREILAETPTPAKVKEN